MDAREARIYIAVIITVVVLGIIIFYFAISIIRQHRRNSELQKENTLAEITAMEKERARIAGDLHDDLGPILSVIKFEIDSIPNISRDKRMQLQKTSVQLDDLIERIREISYNLMPTALQRKGLVTALEEFITKANSICPPLNIRLNTTGKLSIEEEKSIHIFRMLQEIIHNCIRHSSASELLIGLDQNDSKIMILCHDNGIGFDADKIIKDGTGIGLRSLKNRTDMLGGRLKLESKKGKGTSFFFEIPLK
jgi:signal transduction histidine kinase